MFDRFLKMFTPPQTLCHASLGGTPPSYLAYVHNISFFYFTTVDDVIFGFVLWFRPFENATTMMGSAQGVYFLEALYVSKPYRKKHVEHALFERTVQIC